MKRILSTLLSLIFMLGILAIPAEAQGSYCNKVPKVITYYQEMGDPTHKTQYLEKIGTWNGTYNASKKELSYQQSNSWDSEFSLYISFSIALGLSSGSTDTPVNRDYGKCAIAENLYRPKNAADEVSTEELNVGINVTELKDEMALTGIVANDMIRTGKIQKLFVNYSSVKKCYTFKISNNHVIEMNRYESNQEDENLYPNKYSPYILLNQYQYHYDSNGNIVKIDILKPPVSYFDDNGNIIQNGNVKLEQTITIQHSGNRIALVQDDHILINPNWDIPLGFTPKYDNSGNLTATKYTGSDPKTKPLHNHKYRYQIGYNQDKTISTFDTAGEYFTYTYLSI